MFADSHAHLFFKDFKDDLDLVLNRAKDVGVEYIVCPGTDVETSRKSIELAEQYDMVYACVGFHPHDASKADEKSLEEIEKLSHHPKVVAIGEIGLDYHYNFSPSETQRAVFARQIGIARLRNLPIVVHSRESESDTLKIVGDRIKADLNWRSTAIHAYDRYPPPRGVFHCFPGDSIMAWKVIDLGFYISIPGLVTFPNRVDKPNSMVEVVTKVSAEHILLETDSPYLAPAPYRGKRNEPANIPVIAKKIAELQYLSVEDIGRASSFGVHRLFGIGKYPDPVFAYKLRNSLYLNITIRCNADCVFCDRKGEAIIKGHNLRIEKEPTTQDVIQAIGDPKKYDEIVFCGFGEPTIRLDVVKEVSSWIKEHGGKVRLNTDGHGSVINHRNIVPELIGLVDGVYISLNSTDPKQYGALMRIDGEKFFSAMINFAKECVQHKLDVTMTIVDLDEVDEAKARKFVEKEIGAKFKNRPHF
jgi:TatD DNase family protein